MSANRLHVSHYGTDVTREDLNRLFSAYGKVEQVECKSSYAFIEFANAAQADEARRKLDGREYRGHVLTVQQAHIRRDGERRRYDRYDERDRYERDRYERDRYERERYDYDCHYDPRYYHDRHRHHYDDEYDDRYERRRVGGGRHNPPHNSDYRVYITGLTRDYGWREVKDAFRNLSCDVCFADVRTVDGHVLGLAEFERPRDLDIALAQRTISIGTLTCNIQKEHPYHRRSSPRRRSPVRRSPDRRSPARRSVDESPGRSRSNSRSPPPSGTYSPRSPES